jgi:hypothetical protein
MYLKKRVGKRLFRVAGHSMKSVSMTRISVIFLLAFCGVFVGFLLQKPNLNWDMIGYVASARAFNTNDPRLIQTDVYELLARSVSPEKYRELTGGHFRQVLATDPESLRQHLPFYRIRVLYVMLILTFWGLGVNPFFASYFISTVCAALAIMMLAFLFPGKSRSSVLFAVPLIAIATGFHSLAVESTPDALGLLGMLVCYWLLIRRKRHLLLVLPICILIRTDLVILTTIFYIYLWLAGPFDRRLLLISAALGAALYVGVNSHYGNYGWLTIFDYTFLHPSTHPADLPHTVTIVAYLGVLVAAIESMARDPRLATFLVMAFVGLVSLLRQSNHSLSFHSPLQMDMMFVYISALSYVFLHFMLFPVNAIRFYAGPYALSMALTILLVLEKPAFIKPDDDNGG